jgi:hypothetical protein
VGPDPDVGREHEVDYGGCPVCSCALRRGSPPKGGTVGRPRQSIAPSEQAARLREQAAALLARADDIDEP